MLKLFRWKKLEQIAMQPEHVDIKELLQICHQIFLVQSILGVILFIPAAYNHTIGYEQIFNVVVPASGFHYTHDEDPQHYRFIRQAAIYWLVGIVWKLLHFVVDPSLKSLPKTLLLLAVNSLQWVALARLWRMMQDTQKHKASFFLNVVVLNKKAVVEQKVQSKTGWGNSVGTRTLGHLAGALANRMVKDEKFCSGIAAKMAENIPEKMRLSGITAEAIPQFSQGSIFVVQVNILNVDVKQLVAKKAGEEKAEQLSEWLFFLPARFQDEIRSLLTHRVSQGLLQQLPDKVAHELKEVGGIEVAVQAKSPAEEAEYLFALLSHADAQTHD